MLHARTLIAAIVVSSTLAFAPHPAAAQSDVNCPNAVPALSEYLKITKASPDDHQVVANAALKAAEAYNDCGRIVLRDTRQQDNKFQYSEVREASFRIVAARNFFAMQNVKQARSEFSSAEKLAGDVADYTNRGSGSRASIFKDSADEIRGQAKAALDAMNDAAKNPAAPNAAASPAAMASATPAPN